MGLIVLALVLQSASVNTERAGSADSGSNLDSLALAPEMTTLDHIEYLLQQPRWSASASASGRATVRSSLASDFGSLALTRTRKGESDVINGYVALFTDRRLRLMLGNFRSSFGAGLVAGSSRFGTPASAGVSRLVRTPRLSGYAGTSTAYKFLGVALNRVGQTSNVALWRDGQITGAFAEKSASALTLGLGGIRTPAGAFRASAWGIVQLGPTRTELAITRHSIVYRGTLTEGRGRAAVQLSFRVLSVLGPFSRPVRTGSSRAEPERGATLSWRARMRSLRLTAAVDQANLADRAEVQHFVSARRNQTEVRLEQRQRSTGSEGATQQFRRIRAVHATASNPSLKLSGSLAELKENALPAERPGTAGAAAQPRVLHAFSLGISTEWYWRALATHVSLTDYSVPGGGPVLAIYERSAFDVFPIVRLSGTGRRLSARVTLTRKAVAASVSCHINDREAEGPRDRTTLNGACSASIRR